MTKPDLVERLLAAIEETEKQVRALYPHLKLVLGLCQAHRQLVKRYQWAWDRRNSGSKDEQALRTMYAIAMIDVLSDLAGGYGIQEEGSDGR